MKKFLLIICLMTIVSARAQFVVEKQNGEKITIEGDLRFAKDASGENWSIGDSYDPELDLNAIGNIQAKSEVDTDFANKICWVYGVKAPGFPGKENITTYPIWWYEPFPEGEWMRYDYEALGFDTDRHQLTWADTCGWYDCNKTYEYDDAPDYNMCWAASASNLVHWWLVHNRRYIERYDSLYGSHYDFERPSEEFHAPIDKDYVGSKSAVFKFFISMFQDRGGWTGSGVNWFVNGNSTNISAPFRDPSTATTFTGFFPKVFSKQDLVSEDSRNMEKENFNQLMKKAFTERKGIDISVYDIAGTGTGLHSLTVWGAEFDEEGYMSYIYYCDNNMPDQDANGAAIERMAVTYLESSSSSSGRLVAHFMQLPKPQGGKRYTYLVSALSLIDLRQDVWKKAFGDLDDE